MGEALVEDGKIQRFLAQRWLLPQTCSPAFGRCLPFQDGRGGGTAGRDPGWSRCVAGGRRGGGGCPKPTVSAAHKVVQDISSRVICGARAGQSKRSAFQTEGFRVPPVDDDLFFFF